MRALLLCCCFVLLVVCVVCVWGGGGCVGFNAVLLPESVANVLYVLVQLLFIIWTKWTLNTL